MDLRRYSVLGALLFCVAALAVPTTAEAAGGKKKGKDKTEAKAESSDEASDKDGDKAEGDEAAAEPAEEAYEEPDAWERPPVEEEKAPPPEKPKKDDEKREHGDGRHVSIGLLLGYGFEHAKTFGSNPYSLGLGVRGGYTLDFGLYVGGMFTYFIGSSDEGSSAVTAGGSVTASSNYMEFLAEVGYDVWIAKFVLRPYMGLGVGSAFQDNTVYSSPVNSFAFAPGVSVFYAFGAAFLGVDVRFNLMNGNGVDGTVLSLLGGMRF